MTGMVGGGARTGRGGRGGETSAGGFLDPVAVPPDVVEELVERVRAAKVLAELALGLGRQERRAREGMGDRLRAGNRRRRRHADERARPPPQVEHLAVVAVDEDVARTFRRSCDIASLPDRLQRARTSPGRSSAASSGCTSSGPRRRSCTDGRDRRPRSFRSIPPCSRRSTTPDSATSRSCPTPGSSA